MSTKFQAFITFYCIIYLKFSIVNCSNLIENYNVTNVNFSNVYITTTESVSSTIKITGNVLQEIHLSNHSLLNDSKVVAEREVIQRPKSQPRYEEDIRLFLPPDITIILEAIEKLEDKKCKEDVLITLDALNNKEKWAMQMLDSSAKFPQSVLTGSYYQMGNYDECISIRLSERDHNVPRIKGQYCLADVYPNRVLTSTQKLKTTRYDQNSTLHWAICIPHSCKAKETSKILKFILNGVIGSSNAFAVEISERMCHTDHEIPYSIADLIYGYVIVAFLSVIVLATFYHIFIYYLDNQQNEKILPGIFKELVLSFSLVKNVTKLMKTKESDLNLNSICGIKFLSMILIIIGHSLLFLCAAPTINEEFLTREVQKTENGIFLNNPLLVDTFLLVSGFLMCRLLLLELDKRKGKVNFPFLYVFRFIRLTPVYVVVIGFYMTWFVRMDQGPLWDSRILTESERCQSSWWANILYLNNYVNVQQLCMFQSWYLAVDTQLFILAPLIVYPLWKWKLFGQILLGICTIVSIVIPFAVTSVNKLDPTILMFVPELQDLSMNTYFVNAYIKTHMRANSYFFGLFFGYVIHKIQLSDLKLPKTIVAGGWILGLLCTLSSMFSITVFYDPDYKYNALEAGAYAAFHRVAWCLGIGWIIIACVTNNAGPVQKFLCWKPFIPLSRLTYSAYLANGLIELHSLGTMRQPRYMSVYELTCAVLGHLILTFTLAFILCIVFESPIHCFGKMILRFDGKRKRAHVSPAA